MAVTRRNRSRGLTIGQVLTLTLGFLVASMLIFVFGIWVGKDLVERHLAQEERIVRKPIDRTMAAEGPAPDVDVTIEGRSGEPAKLAEEPLAAPTLQIAASTPAAAEAAAAPTPFHREEARPTSPPHLLARTMPTPIRERMAPRSIEEWADAGWTVQVYATTDPNQATALARRLHAKGYDAYTLQAPMRGQTWYRVRVGRFATKERAREMEMRLKRSEGLEAAYITAQ
jgi:cell division septation protein DedD